MSLTLDALRKANISRAAKWSKGKPAPLSFAFMELAGETGEACNAGKKLAREDMGWVGGTKDTTNLIEELADVIICVDLIAMRLDIDLGEAVARKFNATSEKYGFSERLSV